MHLWEIIQKKVCLKIYIGQFKEFHDSKFDKKLVFATGSANWTYILRVIWNSSGYSKETLSKIVQLWQYLAIKLSFIFQFHLVPFAFILILGGPLI